jgi:hypothetical protein
MAFGKQPCDTADTWSHVTTGTHGLSDSGVTPLYIYRLSFSQNLKSLASQSALNSSLFSAKKNPPVRGEKLGKNRRVWAASV